jgi:hypothetical protein
VTDHDFAQRAVLAELLDAHPRLLGSTSWMTGPQACPELVRRFESSSTTGRATKLGDRVGASRAAVRFKALHEPA